MTYAEATRLDSSEACVKNLGSTCTAEDYMGAPKEIVQRAYEAFGRGDVPAILDLVGDEVDWEFVASAGLPYAGRRTTRDEVAAFFADIPRADQIHEFEPREFIEAGDHVTVLGWEKSTALDTGKTFESEWVHVFTVQGGKITRWRGFFNTAARYGK
ncbi:nuclear transport factor 2 family protein [Caballeronia ptereochthonis]|nr:nuclear transport factor 2 family protein [Caballeronia ptereochthonis]